MFLLAHVCAEFRDRKGNVIHRITRNDLNLFHEAPDAIQEDPLFALLVKDESIIFPPKDEKEKRKLENNPMAGIDATGKKIKAEADAEKAEAPVRTETKAENKPAGKPAAAEQKK